MSNSLTFLFKLFPYIHTFVGLFNADLVHDYFYFNSNSTLFYQASKETLQNGRIFLFAIITFNI